MKSVDVMARQKGCFPSLMTQFRAALIMSIVLGCHAAVPAVNGQVRVVALPLNPGYGVPYSAVIDIVSGFAYFGTFRSGAALDEVGQVVKIGTDAGTAIGLGQVASAIVSGGTNLAYIYPATAMSSKLPGVVAADPSDIFAAAGALQAVGGTGYRQAWDNNPNWVSLTTGRPLGNVYTSGNYIILTGGPGVHNCIKYYMDLATGADQSPAYFRAVNLGGVVYYQFILRSSGSVIASVPATDVTGLRRDLCLIQCFRDTDSRVALIITGLTLKGTEAGAFWVVRNVIKNPSSFMGSIYVIGWNDLSTAWSNASVTLTGNNDGFVDDNEIQMISYS